MYEKLTGTAQRLREDLAELQRSSRLTKRFEDFGGGLVVITPKPFHWEPLAPQPKQLQGRLRAKYVQFSDLVDAVLAAEPASTQKQLETLRRRVVAVINQDSPTAYGTAEEAGDGALAAVHRQLALVGQLPFDERLDPIVVADTNALIHNPALDAWTFAELRRFRLVITPTTLKELDVLKTRPALRDKAERLIRQYRDYRGRGDIFEGVTLRNGVSTIFSIAPEPNVVRSLSWLDPSNEDDRLLASVIDIARRNVRVPTVLVTRDVNLENKADFAGIPCLPPPDPQTPAIGA